MDLKADTDFLGFCLNRKFLYQKQLQTLVTLVECLISPFESKRCSSLLSPTSGCNFEFARENPDTVLGPLNNQILFEFNFKSEKLRSLCKSFAGWVSNTDAWGMPSIGEIQIPFSNSDFKSTSDLALVIFLNNTLPTSKNFKYSSGDQSRSAFDDRYRTVGGVKSHYNESKLGVPAKNSSGDTLRNSHKDEKQISSPRLTEIKNQQGSEANPWRLVKVTFTFWLRESGESSAVSPDLLTLFFKKEVFSWLQNTFPNVFCLDFGELIRKETAYDLYIARSLADILYRMDVPKFKLFNTKTKLLSLFENCLFENAKRRALKRSVSAHRTPKTSHHDALLSTLDLHIPSSPTSVFSLFSDDALTSELNLCSSMQSLTQLTLTSDSIFNELGDFDDSEFDIPMNSDSESLSF